MSHDATVRPWSSRVALFVLLACTSIANAFDIINQSSYTISYSVIGNPVSGSLGPAESVSIPAPPNGFFVVQIETQSPAGIDSLDDYGWLVRPSVQGEGDIIIEQFARPVAWFGTLGTFPSPYAIGTRNDGSILSQEPVAVGQTHRDVRFLASADCQFCEPDPPNSRDCIDIPFVTNQLMGSKVGTDGVRGVVMAGDLTQSETFMQRDLYIESITPYEQHFFDGLGNHDLDSVLDLMRPYVRNKKRSTVRSNRGTGNRPHYSWDWHDVHFVQLNVLPSDRVVAGVDVVEKEPFDALTYLSTDLALNVGDSGRPVILIHHYGFGSFSAAGWWDAGQRLDYWEVIKDYNVVLIIVGHLHLEARTSRAHRYTDFMQPFGATGGPALFKSVNASAGLNGTHVEVEINERNQVQTRVMTPQNTIESSKTRTHDFELPIYIGPSSRVGYGWKDLPYQTIVEGLVARNLPSFPGTTPPKRELLIAPGTYVESQLLQHEGVIAPDGPGDIIIRGE